MKYYSNELSVQYLVALLKAHNIRHIFASPGTTNLSFVASLQCDPFFTMYSCVDERSAAYMACGLAAEIGEPVIITCTGATASRNYLPGLTEAFYRKLPILAVTGTQFIGRIGDLHSQLIDRSSMQKDVSVYSTLIPSLTPNSNFEEKRFVQAELNKAINALFWRGGGPVHINLTTQYSRDFSIKQLPEVKVIKRYGYKDIETFPQMRHQRIGIFVGSHKTFSSELTNAVDRFCASRNAVVFCDHTSGYYGDFKINFSLITVQSNYESELANLDLCIHIGEISAEYGCLTKLRKNEVWRVSEDGEIRDQFNKLTAVFDMVEADFFSYYTLSDTPPQNSFYKECCQEYQHMIAKMPDIPFSNIWVASKLSPILPEGSCLHLGILNSTRSWNLFLLPKSITSFANVGGFGIDGGVSSLIGASLAHKEKIYFGVVGDLAFFYDMNSLGNRHIGNNVRLLIVNNGRGTEFRNFYHTGYTFGDAADSYIAAAGHFGMQSRTLVKDYAENLGFEYISACDKEEFLQHHKRFISPHMQKRSIVFEIFTDSTNESEALKAMWGIENSVGATVRNRTKKIATSIYGSKFGNMCIQILGKRGIALVRKMLHK